MLYKLILLEGADDIKLTAEMFDIGNRRCILQFPKLSSCFNKLISYDVDSAK